MLSHILFCRAKPARITYASTSSCSRLLATCIFIIVGQRPLHEFSISALSRSPLGRAKTFPFQHIISTARVSRSVSVCSPYSSALTFPFLLLFPQVIYCTRKSSLQTLYILGLLLTHSIYYCRLRYLLLFQYKPPFVIFH